MTDPEPRDATALVGVLRRNYLPAGRPPGGYFGAEIESPCGRRRADALWMPTTHGKREIIGHEIKVTRSDVLAELADPTKADAWLRYCTRWWLVVVHPDLVRGLDIPEQWGVMSPPSGRRTRSMTVVREAPKLTPAETGPGFHRLATTIMHRTEARLNRAAAERDYAQRESASLERQVAELRASGVRPDSPEHAMVSRIVARLQPDRFSGGLPQEHLEDVVVAALTDLSKVHQVADTARWELHALQRTVGALLEPMKHLNRELADTKAPEVAWP